MRRRQGLALSRAAVVGYGAFLAAVLLYPDGMVLNRFFVGVYAVGLRFGWRWSPEDYASFANGVAFAPLAFGLVVAWPRVRPWVWGVVLVAASAGAEIAQLSLARQASVADVLTNGAGAVVGTVLGAWRVKVSERSGRLAP